MTFRELVAFVLGLVVTIIGADVAFMRQQTACSTKVADAFTRGTQAK